MLISGIQPSGKLHIGNYLGALKHFVDLQNSEKYECYFFIADLHSLTENYVPQKKQRHIIDLAIDFLATGLDPKKSTIFIQSHVPAHTQLAWILNTLTPFGELSRMTQFKDKSHNQRDNINVGLFTYPVLQAADILLYNSTYVPVGQDQIQHLELSRVLARRFNNRFGKTFIEPKPLLTSTPKIMSLSEPTKKMSKSLPQGCLFLDDTPHDIESKIMKATTDSYNTIRYNTKKQPGISNLLEIYSALSKKPVSALEKEFKNYNYGECKECIASFIITSLEDFRESKKKWLRNKKEVLAIVGQGSKKANSVATHHLSRINKKIGLM